MVYSGQWTGCSAIRYSVYKSQGEEKAKFYKLPMLSPPHPGSFIRTEVLDPLGLSVSAAAKALKVSRPTLSSLLNGRAALSGSMALRLEKAFGVDMETLMRMQSSYDIAQTRRHENRILVSRFIPKIPPADRAGDRP